MNIKVVQFRNNDGTFSVTRASKKEGLVVVMLSQETYSNNGIAINKSSRRAFLRLPVALAESLKLADGDDFNKKLESIGLPHVAIIRKESTTPFYEGQAPKMNPTTQEIIKDATGAPVYMQDTALNVGSAQDELISSGATVIASASADAGDHA